MQAASRGVERPNGGDDCSGRPRADQLQHPAGDIIDQELDRDVRDTEERSRRDAQQQALGSSRDPAVRRQRGDPGTRDEHSALDRDQRRRGVFRRLAVGRVRGDADDREACRRDEHAHPLPSTEPEAEEPLREDAEKDQPAGEDGLYGRKRGESERANVQRPRAERNRPSRSRTTSSGTG